MLLYPQLGADILSYTPIEYFLSAVGDTCFSRTSSISDFASTMYAFVLSLNHSLFVLFGRNSFLYASTKSKTESSPLSGASVLAYRPVVFGPRKFSSPLFPKAMIVSSVEASLFPLKSNLYTDKSFVFRLS